MKQTMLWFSKDEQTFDLPYIHRTQVYPCCGSNCILPPSTPPLFHSLQFLLEILRALHVDCLVKAKDSISSQKPINSIWCKMSPGLRNLQVRLRCSIICSRVCNVRNEDEAGCFNALDERWREVEQARAADQAHKIIVPCNLYGFFN